MPNQIRLTVLGPRGGGGRRGRECDVLVTAPAGTVLAAITGGLSAALASAGGAETPPAQASTGGPGGTGGPSGGESAAVYAGARRLDPQRQIIGEPPLVDGAVLSLHGPAEEPATAVPGSLRLEASAGPDSGGIHLLHAGEIRIGRSPEADVVLDDPDVSRLHCLVSVTDSGAVTVTDLHSTNGTSVAGRPVGERPVPLPPRAALRIGETVLRLRTGEPPVPAQAGPAPAAPPTGLTTHGSGPAGVLPPPPPTAPPGALPGAVPGALPPTGEPSAGGRRRARGGLGSWARRLGAAARDDEPAPTAYDAPAHGTPPHGTSTYDAPGHGAAPPAGPYASGGRGSAAYEAPGGPTTAEPIPDSAALLLTALDQGPRLWQRHAGHPDALTVRLGTTHYGSRPPVPVTVGLRTAGSLGLAGPRARLLPLARSVLAQLAVLHPPSALEIVVLSAARGRTARDWTWLGWLPQVRPQAGQDCRLLFGFDREQATARTEELVRRLDEGPLGAAWVTAEEPEIRAAAADHKGPATVLVVDGDPGTAALRETVARLAGGGSAAGVHVLCLAETPATTATSPLADTLSAAYAAFPAFRGCGAVALLSGAVATSVRVVRRGGDPKGELATVDGVSAAWAQRCARALAPLRESAETVAAVGAERPAAALPPQARLLDELGLARATPAALLARWASAADERAGAARATDGETAAGGVRLTLGAGGRGPVAADLAADRSHLLVSGGAGSGKTELLCSLAAALTADERPDRLGLVLVDGGTGEGLRACSELPHVSTYLAAGDPVRMREFAQALSAELKRRGELLGDRTFEAYALDARHGTVHAPGTTPTLRIGRQGGGGGGADAGPLTDSDRGTLRLRPESRADGARPSAAPQLPRLAVLVDDFDALVDPALGNPGRPAAGSVVRALESVAREGCRLGVHLIAATGRPDRTAQTVTDQVAALRVSIGGDPAAEEHRPGRGVLHRPDGTVVPFQAARVTGRIPRTATTRPTVVPLDWSRAGDPPSRRPVRELGNGPTDLALLASAVARAAQEAAAPPLPPLLP